MSGAPVSLPFILEVVLIKRFVSILLSFVLAVGLAVDFAPRGKAIAPLALAQAALASYVASTGYQLYIDNGTGNDLIGLTSDLYGTYLQSHPTEQTLLLLLEGNFIYSDNSGNIILSKTAADTFQRFSDWLATEYSIIAGGSSVTVIQGGAATTWPTQTSGTFVANRVISPLAFLTGPVFDEGFRFAPGSVYNQLVSWCEENSNYCIQLRYPANAMPVEGVAGNINAYAPGTYNLSNNVLAPTRLSFQGTVAKDGNILIYSLTAVTPGSNTKIPLYPGKRIAGDYAYLNSASITYSNSGGLALGLAQDVIDKAAGLTDGKSLVLDVGAAAGDTADEIVDAVIAGYDTVTGTLPVTDTVVDTAVIDTPVQPYPDVDSLGLPELGLALTTRFPFSIPWDVGAIYGALSHSEVPPIKTFDLIPSSVLARWGINASASITLDFTQEKFQVLFAIIHWACIIGFCLGLATLTKRYIWTTGG